jgi:hypothetical protein
MGALGSILASIGFLIHVVCFIMVLVKMFQNGKSGLGIACIVLALCCGVGSIVAFIYGWVKSTDWNIRNLMVTWTVGVVLCVAGGLISPPDIKEIQRQMQQQGQPVR